MSDKVILSDMFPKLHPYNLIQLASAIRFFGEVWIHGDGNMYPKKKDSDDRSIFYNQHPVNDAAKYRKLYTRVSQIPEDLEDLEDDLIQARRAEDAAANNDVTRQSGNPLAFDVPPPSSTAAQSPVGSAAPFQAVKAAVTDFAPPPPPPPPIIEAPVAEAPAVVPVSDAPAAAPVAAPAVEAPVAKKTK